MRRIGFTVMELMVAIALGALVLLAGRAAFEGISDGARNVAERSRTQDRHANADLLLRRLLLQVEVGTTFSGEFSGTERAARFTTWCDTPSGWLERCSVVLALIGESSERSLIAEISDQEMVELRSGIAAGNFAYLDSSIRPRRWVGRWPPGINAPEAVLIVTDGDSTILRVGRRG